MDCESYLTAADVNSEASDSLAYLTPNTPLSRHENLGTISQDSNLVEDTQKELRDQADALRALSEGLGVFEKIAERICDSHPLFQPIGELVEEAVEFIQEKVDERIRQLELDGAEMGLAEKFLEKERENDSERRERKKEEEEERLEAREEQILDQDSTHKDHSEDRFKILPVGEDAEVVGSLTVIEGDKIIIVTTIQTGGAISTTSHVVGVIGTADAA